jgi:hypothetical protein
VIGEGTAKHVACHVLDCKVTGKAPAKADRPFICAKHMGVCNSASLTQHANAAANLIDRRRMAALPGATEARQRERLEQVRIYERIEEKAWRVLYGQVSEKFEVGS